MQYLHATHAYALGLQKSHPVGSNKRIAEYGVYRDTAKIPEGRPALIFSFRQREELQEIEQRYGVSFRPTGGYVYNPAPFGEHNMRANGAWLMGLAHNK